MLVRNARLPCPFDLAAEHLAWLSAECVARGVFLDDAPLFPTADWCTVEKTDMVATFEAAAVRLGLELLTPNGTRRFGGHTLRVMGVQAYARLGLEVNKIRILARHSGDMILRYVADIPLASMRMDLGLASSSTSHAPAAELKRMSAALSAAMDRLAACEGLAVRLSDLVVNPSGARFLQNVKTSCVHVILPLGGERASCGWSVGSSKVRSANAKPLASLAGVPWFMLCKRCLCSERLAARDAQGSAVVPLSDSE